MSVRTFVFCDICNAKAVRNLEERRNPNRGGGKDTHGRRISDGRAWFEGSAKEAVKCGWHIHADGRHICPRCHNRGLAT